MQQSVRPSLQEINKKNIKIQGALRELRIKLEDPNLSPEDKAQILDLLKNYGSSRHDSILLDKMSQISDLLEPDRMYKLSEIEDVFK
jgi:hypothetical protein